MIYNQWPDIHYTFQTWLQSRHTKRVQQEYRAELLETGEYPKEFLEYWREQVNGTK